MMTIENRKPKKIEGPDNMHTQGKPYVIPRYYIDPEDGGLVDLKKFPHLIIGDDPLCLALQATKQSLHRWKRKGWIPFARKGLRKYLYIYNLRDVVTALEKHYLRDVE